MHVTYVTGPCAASPLTGVATSPAGQPMLVPLTQSVYVAGELADNERVMLDIGTGYFMEVPPPCRTLYPQIINGRLRAHSPCSVVRIESS